MADNGLLYDNKLDKTQQKTNSSEGEIVRYTSIQMFVNINSLILHIIF